MLEEKYSNQQKFTAKMCDEKVNVNDSNNARKKYGST
jgi:hypothetical protein